MESAQAEIVTEPANTCKCTVPGLTVVRTSGGTALTSPYTLTASTTLYAQWNANATDDYSFNTAGGSPTPSSGSGLDGTTITLPGAADVLAGYSFDGWNDGTLSYPAGATYTLSSDGAAIVLTAQWNANATDDYSFDTVGGSPTPSSGSGLDGTTITLPGAPTRWPATASTGGTTAP